MWFRQTTPCTEADRPTHEIAVLVDGAARVRPCVVKREFGVVKSPVYGGTLFKTVHVAASPANSMAIPERKDVVLCKDGESSEDSKERKTGPRGTHARTRDTK